MANEPQDYSISALDPVAPFEYFRVFRQKANFTPEETDVRSAERRDRMSHKISQC
jgi:hypothetical protein